MTNQPQTPNAQNLEISRLRLEKRREGAFQEDPSWALLWGSGQPTVPVSPSLNYG